MGGLALGGLLGGRFAEHTRNPLRAYAVTELIVGILGLLVFWSLDVIQVWYVWLAAAFAERQQALIGLRFGLSLLVRLPSTMCMGATLPLLARATLARLGSAAVGQLYSANTAGAVLGTLMTGFVLIGLLGMRASTLIAAALNLGVGIYLISTTGGLSDRSFVRSVRMGGASIIPPVPPRSAVSSVLAQRAALLVLALSGLTGLAYEVVWTRLAAVLVFGLVYGFTLMLAVLLTGIAFGSALYGRWGANRIGAVWQLAFLHVSIGALVGSSPLWLRSLTDHPLAALLTGPVLDVLANHNLGCSSCTTVLGGLLALVFVTSMLFGFAFPAAVRGCTEIGPRWTAKFGGAYAVNVIGAVTGSLLAGFVLVPWLGAHVSLLLLAAVNVLAGVLLAMSLKAPSRGMALLIIGAVPITASLAGGSTVDVYRSVLKSRLSPGADILWYREGVDSSVAISFEVSPQSGNPEPVKRLLINGDYHSSSDQRELAYHRLLGHIGPLLHPGPNDVLVIGLAGGATAGTIALYPDNHVHVVELSDAVFNAAEQFADFNYAVMANPRVTFQNDDGRNYLLVSGQKYDLIEADLLYPRHVGSGVIYSREYFELVRRSLKPGGLAIQWMASNPWTLRTFASVFPYITYWGGAAVGSNEPQPPPDPERFERMQRDPALNSALRDAGLVDAGAFLSLGSVDPPVPVKDGPVISDDRPAIEYFLTLPLLTRLSGSSQDDSLAP
jgi:predicted membrane-bound spermidine synthase